jgi:hypothetical protein
MLQFLDKMVPRFIHQEITNRTVFTLVGILADETLNNFKISDELIP